MFPNAAPFSSRDRTSNSFQPQEKVMRKFASKIKVEKYDGPATLPSHISTALSEHSKTQSVKTVKSRWVLFKSGLTYLRADLPW